jgi:hypothetical protein
MRTTGRQKTKLSCLLRSGGRAGSKSITSSTSNVSIAVSTDSNGDHHHRTRVWSMLACREKGFFVPIESDSNDTL